ncbi:MAG: hypothetical protein C0609_07500 [Deltaproteobacteria bacterium]|nr:MAG: hypothetical protein C0609_07500 [Deltaproteobacteria bacterium]
MSTYNPDFASPCGLYCGVCAIHIAGRDNNEKLKMGLLALYRGETEGKGKLPGAENLTLDDIHCDGCLSDERFMHCKQCELRNCSMERELEGCHQCGDFPCEHIETFPMTVGKGVILRSVPYRREFGTAKWIADEEARYLCPECGNKVFRGAMRCNKCKSSISLD